MTQPKDPKPKVKMVCNCCKGDDVMADAYPNGA